MASLTNSQSTARATHRIVHFEECDVVLEGVIIVVRMTNLADDGSLDPQLSLGGHPDVVLSQHGLAEGLEQVSVKVQ